MILEARDRIGGRTHTEDFAGKASDLGGTWVHWAQAHIWAEITRYGIELEESAGYSADDIIYLDEQGQRFQGKASQLGMELYGAVQSVLGDARTLTPRPAEPFFDPAWIAQDKYSIAQKLDAPGISKAGKALADSMFSVLGAAPPKDISWIEIVRLYALSGADLMAMNDIVGRFKIKGGLRSLYEALRANCSAEIRLNTPIAKVIDSGNGVELRTLGGENIRVPAVISTIPLNVLKDVSFSPPLPEEKIDISRQEHAGKCSKIHVLLDRTYPMFSASAPGSGNSPITGMLWDGIDAGKTHLIVFGTKDLDGNNHKAVQAAVRQFLPDATVVDTRAHDWNSDPYSKGVWCVSKPGQLPHALGALQAPHGRIFFASGDWASAWRGFIDGAIERGIVASGDVHRLLSRKA